jgi:hypothetical protein
MEFNGKHFSGSEGGNLNVWFIELSVCRPGQSLLVYFEEAGRVSKTQLTQVGRAMMHLGIETLFLIPGGTRVDLEGFSHPSRQILQGTGRQMVDTCGRIDYRFRYAASKSAGTFLSINPLPSY